ISGNNETNTAQTIRVLNNSLILIPELEKQYNAQLRGEQRLHPNLKHCAIDTKTEVEAKVPSVVNPS
ncbi:hypothetical protein ABMY13_23710, partial [Vibrio vulnificus]|uniref:hypothetical protein n=1 Tax=Vibrio vulnificus TaxID=672 RepID=UPI004058AF5F